MRFHRLHARCSGTSNFWFGATLFLQALFPCLGSQLPRPLAYAAATPVDAPARASRQPKCCARIPHQPLRQAPDAKKEEFRKYLERSGVIDSLTKVLVGLYEEPEKPANALDFIKMTLGAPTGVDVDALKAENEQLQLFAEARERMQREEQQKQHTARRRRVGVVEEVEEEMHRQ